MPNDATPQTDESQKTACAEDANTLTLDAAKLRLIVITIRRALVAALKLCDQLAEQLKTK